MGLQELKDKVDLYKDTIYAIVGLINLFRYDDENKKMKNNVVAVQGCKLFHLEECVDDAEAHTTSSTYVTPDIGIVFPNELGLIGEVKASFPQDETFWKDDLSYL